MSAILPLPTLAPHRGGLASILAPLTGRDGEPLPESEWARGVIWTNTANGETFVAGFGGGSFGAYADDNVKPTNPNPGEEEFEPVALGAMYECQMNAPGGTLGDVSRQRAVQRLELATYPDLARLLATGEAYPCGAPDGSEPNPSLQSVAQLPVGFDDTPGSVRGALQGILDGMCAAPDGNGGWLTEPVFHIPFAWKPHFMGELVHWSEVEQRYKLLGLYDVSFDCYPNEAPAAGGTTAVDGSEVWIYASLRPEAAVAEITTADARIVEQNRYKVRAERQAIIAFDTTLVMAAKALVG